MTARRDLEIRKSEDCSLQANAAIQLIDGGALANNDVCHRHQEANKNC